MYPMIFKTWFESINIKIDNTIKKHMHSISFTENVIYFVCNIITSFETIISKDKLNYTIIKF